MPTLRKSKTVTTELDLDPVCARKDTSKGVFILTVQGQYYATQSGGGKGRAQYTIDVRLPASMMDRPLSIIKNKILDVALAKKYDNYAGYRTYEIKKVVAPDEASSRFLTVGLMSRDQLIKYVYAEALDFDPTKFRKAVDLRKAITDFNDNPELFKKRYIKMAADMDVVNEVLDLNVDIMGDGGE